MKGHFFLRILATALFLTVLVVCQKNSPKSNQDNLNLSLNESLFEEGEIKIWQLNMEEDAQNIIEKDY